MGIKTALAHKGSKINVIRLDHKANSRRSLKNIQKAVQDPNMIAVFSGMHSPPILANKKFINENKVLFLVPWAAAGPITRSDSKENWIFRLSVDDSKAGAFLVQEVNENKLKKPFLLLEKTGWGQTNHKNITAALREKNLTMAGTEFFNWNPTETNVKIIVRKILNSGADSIIFVGNSNEGTTFAKALHSGSVKVPIISHWGITGGDFFKNVGPKILENQHWCFVQTQFSFLSPSLTDYQNDTLKLAVKSFPEHIKNGYIDSPTGFIHAHDLTLILLEAIKQAGSYDKEKIHASLENLQNPVQGLIKSYTKPFSKYSKENPDAHEALGSKDLSIGIFDSKGRVKLK